MWNGFSMISKRPELTEGMMQTLVEAERTLLESPGKTVSSADITQDLATNTRSGQRSHSHAVLSTDNEYSVDDRCVIHLLKGLCLKNQGLLQAAEECFSKVCSR